LELAASPARAMLARPPPLLRSRAGPGAGKYHAKDRPGALPQAGGMRLIVSRRWADVHGGRVAGKLRIADSARLAFVRPALPARLTLRKCHESETDLGVIAVRQPRKPRSHMINMSCAMRPYTNERRVGSHLP
jgi:hypothetical protein